MAREEIEFRGRRGVKNAKQVSTARYHHVFYMIMSNKHSTSKRKLIRKMAEVEVPLFFSLDDNVNK